jgi:hypothetical protein
VAVAVDDLGEPRIWARTMEVMGSACTAVSCGAFLGGNVELDHGSARRARTPSGRGDFLAPDDEMVDRLLDRLALNATQDQ